MLYLAVTRETNISGYDKHNTVFVYGYENKMCNAILNLREIMNKKQQRGIFVLNIKEISFETEGKQ